MHLSLYSSPEIQRFVLTIELANISSDREKTSVIIDKITDFLAHHHLLFDVAKQHLVDTDTFSPPPLGLRGPEDYACRPPTNAVYSQLTQRFPEVLKPELRMIPAHHRATVFRHPAKHNVISMYIYRHDV